MSDAASLTQSDSLPDVDIEDSAPLSSRPEYDPATMKEGYLQKQGQLFKGWKKRWFVCDGWTLSYFHSKDEPKPAASIQLGSATVQYAGVSERWNGPRISVTDNFANVTYILSGEDGEEVLKWHTVLREAIKRLKDKEKREAEGLKTQSAPTMERESMASPRKTISTSSSASSVLPSRPSVSKGVAPVSKSSPALATTIRLENQISTATELLSCLLFDHGSKDHPIRFQADGVREGVRVSTATDAITGKQYVRASVVLDIVPALTLRVLLDHSKRHEWDAHFPDSVHVASYGGSTDLVYLSGGSSYSFISNSDVLLVLTSSAAIALVLAVLVSPTYAVYGALAGGAALLFLQPQHWQRLVQPRDALVLRHMYEAADTRRNTNATALVVAEWSVTNELKPIASGKVRARIGISGWLVQPFGTESTLLTHVIECDLGGYLPRLVHQSFLKSRAHSLASLASFVSHAKIRGSQLGYDADVDEVENENDIDGANFVQDDANSTSSMSSLAEIPPFHPRSYFASVVRNPAGGVTLTDKEIAKKQNGVLLEVIKNFGTKLLDGKSAVSLSLPVRIFEPRTNMDRLVDIFLYAPKYLSAANEATDVVERFKLTITFAIAGWHHWIGCAKPFIPILGETMQAEMSDGATVHCEQVSNRPVAITYAHIVHSNYQITSRVVLNGNLQGNTVVQTQQGPVSVHFLDGSSIDFSLPTIRASGFLWGDRIIDLSGTIMFQDKTNGLQCELRLNPDENKGMFANRAPTDFFRGSIVRTATNETVCDVTGSWLDNVKFGGETYWDFQRDSCAPLTRYPDDQVLPSDSRFRADLRALAQNDLEEAQERKHEIEAMNRNDRELRKEGRRPNHWTFNVAH